MVRLHPPCTPSASCTPVRCHPTPPPCPNPEKCFQQTTKKRTAHCPSAVSILKTRRVHDCKACGKYSDKSDPRSLSNVDKFLKRKKKESDMKRKDRLKGTYSYPKYMRKKGTPRKINDACCYGKGHRGRLKKKKCVIL